jgi:hypothetical protein
MRPITMFIFLAAFARTLCAQQEIPAKADHETRGFGGPVAKITSVNGKTALLLGGRGGWIFDHSLVLGGGIYTLANEIDAAPSTLPAEGPLDVDFSYFGLEAEYVFRSAEIVHYTLYGFLGIGAVRLLKDPGSFSKENTQVQETNWTFVFEPAANVEVNVASWCRVMGGVSYRVTTGVTQVGLGNKDFTGLAASLTLKLGSF